MPRVLSFTVHAGSGACTDAEAVRAVEVDLLGENAPAILTEPVPATRVLAGRCREIHVTCLSAAVEPGAVAAREAA